jgi:hypothetical protein
MIHGVLRRSPIDSLEIPPFHYTKTPYTNSHASRTNNICPQRPHAMQRRITPYLKFTPTSFCSSISIYPSISLSPSILVCPSIPPYSSISATNSKHSLVTFTPSSITACGSAKLALPPTPTAGGSPPLLCPFPFAILAAGSVFGRPFECGTVCVCVCLCVPFVFEESGVAVPPVLSCDWGSDSVSEEAFCRASSVSARTSANTRSISFGKVVISPERRRVRAWVEMREGQFALWAWRWWWRVWEILWAGEVVLALLFACFVPLMRQGKGFEEGVEWEEKERGL